MPAAKPNSDVAFLCRALKAPSLAAAVGRLGERARAEGWSHEELLAACLEREVAARQDHPGTGKIHLAVGLGIRACQAGHRVAFATAAEWLGRLGEAHAKRALHAERSRLGRFPLLVIDEVGYIPFEAEAANLFFQMISARYERASVIVTSNKPFGRWGDVFGDPIVAAAMIDRLVHHAEVVSLKGDSYRPKDRRPGDGAYQRSLMTRTLVRVGQFSAGAGGSFFGRC